MFNPIAAIAKSKEYLLNVLIIGNKNNGIRLQFTAIIKTINPLIKKGIGKDIFFEILYFKTE